jgi:lipoate-protein ligase A
VNSRLWHVLKSGAGEGAFNMALDEALLQAVPRLGRPVLRFYGWTERAASFGYFQKYSEIERLTTLRPLIRRPTGGGLVSHDADWTYSLAFPPGDYWYSLAAIESYRRVHEWIQAAFARLNIPTDVADECRKTQPGQCFQGHEEFDLLWHGQKIAGAAQRRTRDGLLIQGSIQPASFSATRTDWEKAMCAAAESHYGVTWESLEPDALLQERPRDLVRQKYSQSAYNEKR